ncbi:MAG: hypothetical protein ACRBCT_04160 [Alphaproteobacteria bacterium]
MPQNPPQTPQNNIQHRALTLDVDVYQHMLNAPDLSEDQKRQMIEVLWLLVVSFVDLEFEILLEDSCGKPTIEANPAPSYAQSMLDLSHSPSTNPIANAANTSDAPRPEQEAS